MTDEPFPRPRIFVSSTIQDFRDLRGALKYWLEQRGFVVQLSEWSDFEHRPEAGVLEACFESIRRADFYVLIIGDRIGLWFDEQQRISITRQEYRVAYGEFEASGAPKIIPFIRRSNSSDGGDFRHEFINEVRRHGDSTARGNWTIEFSTFEELVNGLLSAVPVLRDPLPKQAILTALRHELEYNARALLQKHRGRPFFGSWHLEGLRREVELTRADLREILSTRSMTHEQFKAIVMYSTSLPRVDTFAVDALTFAIHSGALLEFDTASAALLPSRLLTLLQNLKEQMNSLKYRLESLDEPFRRRLYEAWDYVRDRPEHTTEYAVFDLVTLFGVHDSHVNVERATVAALLILHGHDVGETIVMRHSSPVVDERARMDEERPSETDVRRWFEDGDILLGTVLRDLTAEDRERGRRQRAQLGEIIGEEVVSELLRGDISSLGERLTPTDDQIEQLRALMSEWFDRGPS